LLAFLAAVRQVKKVVGKLICGYDGTGRRAGFGQRYYSGIFPCGCKAGEKPT